MIVSFAAPLARTERRDYHTIDMGNLLTCEVVDLTELLNHRYRDDDNAIRTYASDDVVDARGNAVRTVPAKELNEEDPKSSDVLATPWSSYLSTRRRALSGIREITHAKLSPPPPIADENDTRQEDPRGPRGKTTRWSTTGTASPPSALPEKFFHNRSTTMTKKPKEKSVSFASVSVRKTLHRNDYTNQEKVASWITGEEFMTMRRSCVQIARQLNTLTSTKQGLHRKIKQTPTMLGEATRGLERLSKRRLKIQAERRQVLMDEIAFLREHRYQCNPDDLAALFQSYTAQSAMEARAVGREDEKRAHQCYTSSLSSTTTTTAAATSQKAGSKSMIRTLTPDTLSKVAETRNDVNTGSDGRRRTAAGANGGINVTRAASGGNQNVEECWYLARPPVFT